MRPTYTLAVAMTLSLVFAAQGAETRLETSDMAAYYESIRLINQGLTRQEAADFNYKLTLLSYGSQPANMTDDEYASGLITYILEQGDEMLEKLSAYEGWTAPEIMALN